MHSIDGHEHTILVPRALNPKPRLGTLGPRELLFRVPKKGPYLFDNYPDATYLEGRGTQCVFTLVEL